MNIRWRDVSDRAEPVCFKDTFDLSGLSAEHSQIVKIESTHVTLCASMQNQMCTVEGQLETTITYLCSRCLTEFMEPLLVEVYEQFVQDPDKVIDDDDRIHVVTDTIEFDPYLEQAIVLALSYQPLCSVSCKGLCPVCGVNKNEQSCTCDTRRIDPRLAELAKFFEQD